MRYRVELSRSAERVYRLLYERDRKLWERFRACLEQLAANPTGAGKPLKGPLRGRWSLCAGSYRLIYQIDSARIVVIVLDIGHRRDVYQ